MVRPDIGLNVKLMFRFRVFFGVGDVLTSGPSTAFLKRPKLLISADERQNRVRGGTSVLKALGRCCAPNPDIADDRV